MTIRRARRRARRSDTLAVSVALGGALLLAWPSVGQTPPASEPAPKSLLPDSFGPATPPPTAAPLPLPSGDTPETSDPSGALPTAPDGTPADAAAAQPDPFDLPSATGRTVDVAGPLTTAIGGYGIGAFGGSNARFVSGLMRRMDTPLASRWAHIVLRRALLSKSAAPAGVNPADWIAARAGLLLRLGEIDGAKALVDFVPTDRFTPLLYRIAGQVQFAAADPAGMCPIAATGVSVSPDPLWRLSEAMCAALTGDDVSAARGFDALHEKGDVDAFDLRLGERVAALAGTGGRAANINWDEVDGLTPYRFGITAAAGVAVPPALLTSFAVSSHGASYGWVMRASGLPPEVRAAALRPAAALGIAGVGRFQQPFEIRSRKFGVDRQQRPLRAGAAAAHRHADGELHHVRAALPQMRVAHHASLRQQIVQQGAQLGLAPAAAAFHVGEHALQIADLRRHRRHLGHRLLHRGELLDHPAEAGLHLALHRLLQLFVHAALDFGQSLDGVLRHLAQLGFHQHPRLAGILRQPCRKLARPPLHRGKRRPHSFALAALSRQRLFGQQAQHLHVAPTRHGQQGETGNGEHQQQDKASCGLHEDCIHLVRPCSCFVLYYTRVERVGKEAVLF